MGGFSPPPWVNKKRGYIMEKGPHYVTYIMNSYSSLAVSKLKRSNGGTRGKVESFLRMGHKRQQQPENMEIYLADNLVVQCMYLF